MVDLPPQLQHLVHDLTPVGVSVVSPREVRYLYCNQGLADFLGYTVEEVLAADGYEFWVRITPPEDFEIERGALQGIIQGKSTSYQVEKRFVRKDGSLRWGLVTTTAVHGPDGALDLVLAYTVDIHDRRMREHERHEVEVRHGHSQRLESLGQLAGGVAHDFNNRLVIILGHAELMKQQMHPADPLREHLDQVIASARRSADLTRQLLAFSRRQVLAPAVFDLNATVEQMRKMLSRLLGEKIVLDAFLAASGPAYADPGQVEEILVNLALNARDAMPGGGRLLIATRDVDHPPKDLAAGPYVELAVTDSGHGIDPEILPRVFEPFFTTKPVGVGTGLGLSTVMGIARQSGGTVTVDSQPGRGSTFAVLLPRAPRSALVHGSRPTPTSTPMARDRTILLVDDDADVRHLLADIIRLRGYEVLAAAGGEEAQRLAAGRRVDLVATDVVMPGIDGPELVRCLRLDRPELPALFITGHAEAEALSAALACERATLLSKPFAPGDLVRAIDALLTSSRATGHHEG